MSSTTYRAAWIFPVDRPPIRDGVVEIAGERIQRVAPYRSGETVRDLGDVALLPGLVNAHTHLEFSSLAEPLGMPGEAFPDWIRHVLRYRREQAERSDAAESWRNESIVRGLLRRFVSNAWIADRVIGPLDEEAT